MSFLLSLSSFEQVLLGRVKGIQPPMGKKKVALDPTPNFDCHMSRIHPSLKDSVEDQAIGSLVGNPYLFFIDDIIKVHASLVVLLKSSCLVLFLLFSNDGL